MSNQIQAMQAELISNRKEIERLRHRNEDLVEAMRDLTEDLVAAANRPYGRRTGARAEKGVDY